MFIDKDTCTVINEDSKESQYTLQSKQKKSQGSSLIQKNSIISNNFSSNNSGQRNSKGNLLSGSGISSDKSSSELARNIIKRMKMDSINESSVSPLENSSSYEL